jgi:hypothetical protein
MSKPRASIFDDDEPLDLTGFSPKSTPDETAPPRDQVRALSEAAHFPSREAKPAPAEARMQRRYRTGRNVQLNIKTDPETITRFYEISDRRGWVQGETLARALAALERELADNNG